MGKVKIPTVPTAEGTSNRTEESLSALQVLELLPSDCCSSDTEDDRRSDDEVRVSPVIIGCVPLMPPRPSCQSLLTPSERCCYFYFP